MVTWAMQVISLAGELLSLAEGLLQDGLHVSEVADGYKKAASKVPPSLKGTPLWTAF